MVLSDYDDAGMMGDLEENVERSGPGKEARETIKVVGHTWGEDCTPLSQYVPPSHRTKTSPTLALAGSVPLT